MQVPFFLVGKFFGITPLPFKIATFLIHLLNGFLVYKLITEILKKEVLGLVGAFLYLTSATHHILFYWASTFSFVLAQTYFFASFLCFLKKQKKASFLLFIFGLLTNELLFTIPLVMTLWILLNQHRKQLLTIAHFIFASVLYIFLRFVIFSLPKSENYTFITGWKQPLLTLRNFIFWALNWPEEVQGQFTKYIILSLAFITQFKPYVILFFVLTVLFCIFFIIIPILRLFTTKTQITLFRPVLFGTGWFVITSLPVLMFAHHAYTYYVPIPLFGFLLAALSLFSSSMRGLPVKTSVALIFIVGFSLIWFTASLKTIELNQLIHWAPQRAERAYFVASKIKSKYSALPPDAVVIITKDNARRDAWDVRSETIWALGDQNGMRVLYNEPTITTYFGTVESYFTDSGIVDPKIQDKIKATFYTVP